MVNNGSPRACFGLRASVSSSFGFLPCFVGGVVVSVGLCVVMVGWWCVVLVGVMGGRFGGVGCGLVGLVLGWGCVWTFIL